MIRPSTFALSFVLLASGCKKAVPANIASDGLMSAMRLYAPKTVSALCGGKTRGMTKATISNVRIDEKNPSSGTAHVKGSPWFSPGVKLPEECEGDVEFRFTSSTKTTKSGKTRTSTTTWSLEHLKVIAVQTPGVTASNVEEDPEGD